MSTSKINEEKIRQFVRERYGKIARQDISSENQDPLRSAPAAACCGDAAASIAPESGSCGISEAIGYTEKDLADLPEGADMGLGCGNPVAIASLTEGQTVLDLGSGGGIDCFLAAEKVGQTGKVIGVDMTPDMVSKARANAEKLGVENVEFRLGEIEHLPIDSGSVDVILSNCVINLSPEKPAVFGEAHRVLKTGGRLAISDILTTRKLDDKARKDLELISACIGGAATVDETKQMLEDAGFVDVRISSQSNAKDLADEWIPDLDFTDTVISARIEAVKAG